MTAHSLHDTWDRWSHKMEDAMHPHMADAEHPAHPSLADNPMRARLRPVRLVPLIVPGMALVLACCAMAIGWLMRP